MTTLTFTPPAALPQGSYFWRVQATDAAGNIGAESSVRSFTVNILRKPNDGAVFITSSTASVTFRWASVPGASGYVFNLLDDTCTTPESGYPLPATTALNYVVSALAQGRYCWQVQALGGDGDGRYLTAQIGQDAIPRRLPPPALSSSAPLHWLPQCSAHRPTTASPTIPPQT